MKNSFSFKYGWSNGFSKIGREKLLLSLLNLMQFKCWRYASSHLKPNSFFICTNLVCVCCAKVMMIYSYLTKQFSFWWLSMFNLIHFFEYHMIQFNRNWSANKKKDILSDKLSFFYFRPLTFFFLLYFHSIPYGFL